jgi:hypothetical protein
LVSYAFGCCKLPFQRTKSANSTNKNNNYFFHKEEKEKKEEKKDMQVKSHEAVAVKVFWENTTGRVEVFFKNPQGLTFTAGKRNG